MKTNTAQQNIPSGWSVRTLNDLVLIKKGEQLNRLAMDDSGKYPALNGGVSPSGYTDKWNTESNTITISEGGNSCGFVNFNTEKFWCGGHCYALLNINNNLDINFLYQFLKSKQDQIMKLRVGSGLPNIQKRSIEEFSVIFPESKDEQQKIAEILGAVDEDIAKTQEVIKMTEKLKRGLMQQLFTRGIGHTKFKKTKLGEIPDEWEVVKLGDIGTNYIGLTYSPQNVTDYTGILVLRSSNVQDGHISYGDNVYVDSNIPEHLITKKGDILLCTRNGSRNLIGKCAFIDANSAGHSFGAFMSVYRSKYSDFIFQIFLSDIFKNQINKFLGATINQITNSSLNSFIVPLPPVEEQKEIVDILSAIDEKILVNKKLKEKLTLLKKGLMQDLLSGKMRTE